MTAVAERPFTSDAASPEDWLVEVYKTADLKESTAFIDEQRKQYQTEQAKERRRIQLEREAREREDELQEKFREEIRAENVREAERLAAKVCKSCFCLHGGECWS